MSGFDIDTEPILIIGRGRWSKIYQKNLTELNVPFRVVARDYKERIGEYGKAIISTPPDTHYSICNSLISGGLSRILIDKPAAISANEIDALAARITDNIKIDVAYQHLWNSDYQEVIPVSNSALRILSVGCAPGPDRDFCVFREWVEHDLSLILNILPEGKVMHSEVIAKKFDDNKNGLFFLNLKFDNDIRATIKCGNRSEEKERFFGINGKQWSDDGTFNSVGAMLIDWITGKRNILNKTLDISHKIAIMLETIYVNSKYPLS